MIKLLKLLSEINIANTVEEPSYYDNENEVIANYVKKIAKQYPNGIEPLIALEDTEDYPNYFQLKILIELAKKKLLNFKFGGKITPHDVLGIYGNPKDIVKKLPLNLNEKRN